jgi:DNA-binding response OmpR family regulator
VISEFLRGRGHLVTEATEGDTALHGLLSDQPDVMITDLLVTNGVGMLLLDSIRSFDRWESLPIIALAAEDSPDQTTIARERGVAHLFKQGEFRLDELASAILASVS